MKLAEALVVRADLFKQMDQLQQRIQRHAKVQEGDLPGEDPAILIQTYEAHATELVDLITRINLTNASSMSKGKTMTALLAERDMLQQRQSFYQQVAQSASITQSAHTRTEIRFKSAVSVKDTQKEADNLAKMARELDIRIQQENWRVDLK